MAADHSINVRMKHALSARYVIFCIVEKKEEIWLAAGTPRRWLEAGQNIELNRARTEYGEVSYSLRPGNQLKQLRLIFSCRQQPVPKYCFSFAHPFQKPIRHVTINGEEWKEWDADKESIVIPQTSKSVKVAVSY